MYCALAARPMATHTHMADMATPIAIMKTPLPLALAAHVLAWDDYQQLAILDQMGSLLVAEQDVMVFFHKSLHDWVGDADVAGSRWFASESSGHARLARSLLGLRDTVEILSAPVRSYLLRNLPQHLARAGMNLDFERVLSDFVWAMRRVDGENT
jgi:hypothetical protein